MDELREALRSGDADAAESAMADLRMNVSKIGEHDARADAIVRSMLEHSRGTRGERALTGANPLVEEYVASC